MWVHEGDRYWLVQPPRHWKNAMHLDGWMSEKELKYLYGNACEMETIVEIGSWKGKSTYALACGCRGMVYAVDHFLGSKEHQKDIESGSHVCTDYPFEMFEENLSEFDNVSVFRGASDVAAASGCIPPVVDMVFIDGDHTYEGVMTDLKCWEPRARRLVCGHDFVDTEIVRAIGDYFKGSGREIGLCPDTTIWEIWK
jgi:hypothetical protein